MAREQQENNIIPSIYVTNMTLFYSVNSSANYTLMEDRMAFTETNFDLTIRCSNVTSNFFSFDMMVSNISINTHFRGEN